MKARWRVTINPTRGVCRSALLLALLVAGCSRGPVLSPEAYELAKAVDTLFNLREEPQLAKAREIIAGKRAAGTISEREQQLLTDLIEVAAGGNWDGAAQQCRRLLLDQTNR